MMTTVVIVLLLGIGLILFGIFQKSERNAAEPVEKPTPSDLAEGNVSPKLPVADE